MEPTDLDELGTELLRLAGDAPAGRAARQLPVAGEGAFTQTVLAITAGQELAEHDAPASASLQALRGRARFVAEDAATELSAGQVLVIPPSRHRVQAVDGVVLLLTVGRAGDA